MVPYDMTMKIMTPFVLVGMPKSLSTYYKVDDIGGIVLALVAFFILTPQIVDAEGAVGIPAQNLSTSGLFVGMLGTVLAIEIYRSVIQKGWVHPEQFELSHASEHDHDHLNVYINEKRATYVFDRRYLDFAQFDQMTWESYFFVSRIKKIQPFMFKHTWKCLMNQGLSVTN